jgi:uncharacterized protein (DUF58 family)
MTIDPEVDRVTSSYLLGLPRTPTAGRSGEWLGRGTGSSLEFQEYREYLPGDDLRHVDWAAYARTDTLMLRMFREEISPRTEILVDASRSMTTGGGVKERVTRQLATVFAELAGRTGGRPTLWPLRDARPVLPLDADSLRHLDSVAFDAVSTLGELLADHAVSLRAQSVRIVLSDFLFPHDPDPLVRQLAAGASTLWIVQLLTAWEAEPTELGGRRLVDIEGGTAVDLLINRSAVTRYRERLGTLQAELARSCRRVHATFVTLVADRGLAVLCREELCQAGILRPASGE